MLKALKNTAVILLLVAFLLPASGVLVFMHQCRSMGTTALSLDGSSGCCQTRAAGNQSCSAVVPPQHNHGLQISKQACCEDSQFFVKINLDYLTTAYNTFHTDIITIELPGFSGLNTVAFAGILQGLIADTPDPPGNDTYLINASLRL